MTGRPFLGLRPTAAVVGTVLAVSAYAGFASDASRPGIVATIFPLYDWAAALAGAFADVRQLMPPGVEVHAYAPTPADVAAIRAARVFLYCGPKLEPWAERLVGSTAGEPPLRLVVADLARDPARPNDAEMDPHFWTDPVAAARAVAGIADALAARFPAHAEDLRRRRAAYLAELERLDRDWAAMTASARRRTVLYGGHRAFDALGARYGIEFVSPYEGFSPEEQPTPRAMAELVRRIRETGSRVIFTEEIVEPRVARAIALETGAEIRVLHALHNRTPDEARRGETYLSIHRRNLEEVRRVLVEAP